MLRADSGTLSGLSVVANVPLGSAYVNSQRPSFSTSMLAGAPAAGVGGASGAVRLQAASISAVMQARRNTPRIVLILPGDADHLACVNSPWNPERVPDLPRRYAPSRARRLPTRQFTDTSAEPSRPQNVASLS